MHSNQPFLRKNIINLSQRTESGSPKTENPRGILNKISTEKSFIKPYDQYNQLKSSINDHRSERDRIPIRVDSSTINLSRINCIDNSVSPLNFTIFIGWNRAHLPNIAKHPTVQLLTRKAQWDFHAKNSENRGETPGCRLIQAGLNALILAQSIARYHFCHEN